jgi:hypothetical protein
MRSNVILLWTVAATIGLLADAARVESKESDPSLLKYDTNGNGQIDVEERNGYVRERAKLVREQAKREAAQRPVVPPGVREFLVPPHWTKEKLVQYDANHNGKLEPAERAEERRDALKAAEERFRKADKNADGRLDAKEREAAFRPKP